MMLPNVLKISCKSLRDTLYGRGLFRNCVKFSVFFRVSGPHSCANEVKFGVKEWTIGRPLHAIFHWSVQRVAPVGQKTLMSPPPHLVYMCSWNTSVYSTLRILPVLNSRKGCGHDDSTMNVHVCMYYYFCYCSCCC